MGFSVCHHTRSYKISYIFASEYKKNKENFSLNVTTGVYIEKNVCETYGSYEIIIIISNKI